MSAVFASLIPTFLIIATGWLCRATGFVGEAQWAGIERATYVIFFPALIIDTLSRADLGSVPVFGVGGALIGAILLMSALVLALRPWLERRFAVDGPTFTSSGNEGDWRTSKRSCTADSTLLTFWPPGPEARMKLS